MTARRVLFACDLDSQVFGALPIALAFRARGWSATFAIDAGLALPAAITERLAGRFEIVERPLCALATAEDVFAYDAIGVFATGSRIAQFRHAIELAARVFRQPRPALFCGFNGLVYEKFEEGLAWRLGFDQLCLNGPRDRDAFAEFAGVTEFADQPVTIIGLRRKPDEAPRPSRGRATAGRRKRFVFAEQVAVPVELADRQSLIATLARLATASPNWDVVVKARVRPNELTFHGQVGHVEQLVAALPDKPANLRVAYEPLDDLLTHADLFATISSTALFDAFDFGVPSLVVSDFGVRNAYGSHVLVGSGLTASLAALRSLDEAPRNQPEPHWLVRVGYGAQPSPDALIDKLEAFDGAKPLPPAFYSFEHAARAAAPYERHAEAALASRTRIEAALAAGGGEAAREALKALGAALAEADRQRAIDSAWRLREGAAAALARRLGVYWAYKRARTTIYGEVPR